MSSNAPEPLDALALSQRLRGWYQGSAALEDQAAVEISLRALFSGLPPEWQDLSPDYYCRASARLYEGIVDCYRHGDEDVCLWRFVRRLSGDQLGSEFIPGTPLDVFDLLLRIYYYSEPLDDLTCLFVPVDFGADVDAYQDWIQRYFYQAQYPTSLLWLYALDSTVSPLLPDEIIYLGRRCPHRESDIVHPRTDCPRAVLIKRYSQRPDDFLELTGGPANQEFAKLFDYLAHDYKDRCLSQTTNNMHGGSAGWEKFSDVLRFGVSDLAEGGCVSFSDLRSSTEFLNVFGRHRYLNNIQHPFFRHTQFIEDQYQGRIDKFMGDNVMCVFLERNIIGHRGNDLGIDAVLRNFFALYMLSRNLRRLIHEGGYEDSNLGLRSGVTYGTQILRSNLGNDLVRDYTVTGETVNLAARLEHISIDQLVRHNQEYFSQTIERFPQIEGLIALYGNDGVCNPQTRRLIDDYTLYQNILSNLHSVSSAKFDIRMSDRFYQLLKAGLATLDCQVLETETSDVFGYEIIEISGYQIYFYLSYLNPKGFRGTEKIWLAPLSDHLLESLDLDAIIAIDY